MICAEEPKETLFPELHQVTFTHTLAQLRIAESCDNGSEETSDGPLGVRQTLYMTMSSDGVPEPPPSSLTAPLLYPSPSEAALKLQYVGKKIQDVQAPAVIIDAAVVRRNCRLMLETAEKLNVDFRAHVKTHKVRFVSGFRAAQYQLTAPRLRSSLSCKLVKHRDLLSL